jgi:predicted Zn-dependent protease
MVERATEHLSTSYYNVPFRPVSGKIELGDSPTNMAATIGRNLSEEHAGALVLISVAEKVRFNMGIFREEKVALLNVRSLLPTKLRAEKARDAYEKRIMKESVRAIGLLIGLEPTRFPRCAMFPWQTEKELDRKGLNLCPPRHLAARRILIDMGFDLGPVE